jgi:hypothetical protein
LASPGQVRGKRKKTEPSTRQYYPQALELCGEELWRPLATSFLLKWTRLQAVQKAKPAPLKQFYYLHGSRSAKWLAERLALVARAVPVTDQSAVIESFVLRVQLVCRQLQLVQRSLVEFDRQIAAASAAHPDRELFASLPGAGRCSSRGGWPAWAASASASTRRPVCSATRAWPR